MLVPHDRMVGNKRRGTMRVLGIGTDLVYMPRVVELLRRMPAGSGAHARFAGKFMHARERAGALGAKDQARYVAGVWAAKEALYKAVAGADAPPAATLYRACYKEADAVGRPTLQVDAGELQRAGHMRFWEERLAGTRFLLSVSHDEDYLVAFVCHVADETFRAPDERQRITKNS
ncbi:ACR129Wp [Eremothecium gossypii ATCC 10895]|uniref:Mitochondrial holo-[acyl-carrier-protein] synthase n=1 Tax=Eremothecium gossypii (strain ATCC 10895 / CBS 109.51 / FGSC 9923 / NRRL Y-1056) TaxID=284811 RepID=PPT2_EREGS|nr:ACR129Wp [Eremothecium gossypii ATCC 10895]Q75BZ1.2 RecName: Full=Mitochondrial holo-[acyl-carrier-protein] synthase; Short=Mitochondrial holo-ACP synthase; AltName: Full=4'-phosphopantetheinyl transferase PPT2; Short=PPTase [Eremothecium gossypii ATCC 10895]AAS51355.2 ACR129Wp [Eremothecium gossypii ATCC 10895]AEY95646.1 FACR129Wp [Eremothecium gossypii FDAG1]